MNGTLDRRSTPRRTAPTFLAMAAALLLASGAALLVGSGKEADAASRFKVVTRTFSNATAIQQAPEPPPPTHPRSTSAGSGEAGSSTSLCR